MMTNSEDCFGAILSLILEEDRRQYGIALRQSFQTGCRPVTFARSLLMMLITGNSTGMEDGADHQSNSYGTHCDWPFHLLIWDVPTQCFCYFHSSWTVAEANKLAHLCGFLGRGQGLCSGLFFVGPISLFLGFLKLVLLFLSSYPVWDVPDNNFGAILPGRLTYVLWFPKKSSALNMLRGNLGEIGKGKN